MAQTPSQINFIWTCPESSQT